MKRLLAIFTGKHQPDRGDLSAYLDGELTPERAAAVEAHVAACDACRTTLDGMRDVRAMLRALPRAEAPRSFRLRPADVEAAPRRGLGAPPSPLMRAMPMLSAAAVVVFAITVGLDVAGNGASGDFDRASGNTAALSAERGMESADGYQYQAGQPDAGAGSAEDEAPAPNAADGGGAAATPGAAIAPADRATDDGGDEQPPEEPQPEVEATSAAPADDGDGNNLALRIVQIASAAVAIAAAGLALRMWRKRGEAAA